MGATHGNLHKDAKPLPKDAKVEALVTVGKDAEDKIPVSPAEPMSSR
jgi:osmotically inducible protein OsmC